MVIRTFLTDLRPLLVSLVEFLQIPALETLLQRFQADVSHVQEP